MSWLSWWRRNVRPTRFGRVVGWLLLGWGAGALSAVLYLRLAGVI